MVGFQDKSPKHAKHEDEAPTWKPDLSTTEESFYGWGGSSVEGALAEEFLHNLKMARGNLSKDRILGIIAYAISEAEAEAADAEDVHTWLQRQAY